MSVYMSSADKRPYAALNAPFDHRNDDLVRDFETVIVLAARAVAAEAQRRNECLARMDSLYKDLEAEKFSFEDAATYLSSDKDTKNNKGLMVNQNYESRNNGTPKFEMAELPQEIGKVVYTMNVGDISKPFTMINEKNQKEVGNWILKRK